MYQVPTYIRVVNFEGACVWKSAFNMGPEQCYFYVREEKKIKINRGLLCFSCEHHLYSITYYSVVYTRRGSRWNMRKYHSRSGLMHIIFHVMHHNPLEVIIIGRENTERYTRTGSLWDKGTSFVIDRQSP